MIQNKIAGLAIRGWGWEIRTNNFSKGPPFRYPSCSLFNLFNFLKKTAEEGKIELASRAERKLMLQVIQKSLRNLSLAGMLLADTPGGERLPIKSYSKSAIDKADGPVRGGKSGGWRGSPIPSS